MSPGRIGWSALAVAAAILVFQILVPPAIGLADNGDFAKITRKCGLYPPVDDLSVSAFRYIHLHYNLRPGSQSDTGFRSSEALPIRAALWLNRAAARRPSNTSSSEYTSDVM